MPAKAHTQVDDFSDNAISNTAWYTFGRVAEVNQQIQVFPESSLAGSYAGIGSAATLDLYHSAVFVELLRPLSAGSGAETYLAAVRSADDIVALSLSGGRLRATQTVAGAYTELDATPYDAVQHRWLRLRERHGTLFYETSPDGQVWSVVHAVAPPIDLSAVQVEIGAGTFEAVPSPGVAVFDHFNVPDSGRRRRVEERRLAARAVRVQAADLAAARRHDPHVNNNDEVGYLGTPLVGNYSKSLRHDALGDPIAISYASLLRALDSEDPADFEEIILAAGNPIRLINPQAGLAFDVEGPDAQEPTMPPAPRFDSEVTAHEMGELYWMALARDVSFTAYGTDAVIGAAVASLNDEFPRFGGTLPVTRQNVFRGIYPGEQVGPYVSQFLVKGNTDPRKPDKRGRDAVEGFISYGSRVIDQRLVPAVANVDYLTAFPAWLDAQNGVDTRGQDQFENSFRFIRNLRDGATFVHFDQVLDAFYNAALILIAEPTGNQFTFQPGITGRPQIDLEFPKDQGNPYDPPETDRDSRTQLGFGTFGPAHLLQVLGEVLGRAIRAVWWQKWGVHRRARPEEYGGRVHNHVTAARTYPLHPSIVTSLQGGALAPYFGQAGERFPGSYLLPQAYAEGAPTHPAYGAGHATGSGALATMLKAFFDDTKAIENPLQAAADGLSLVAYTGADAAQMTVGGELNKLAGNIALFRNAAGVHWRSDYTFSLPLGEAVAIRMLQEMSLGFNEDRAFFQLTRFDGQRIRIFDGRVAVVE